MAAQRESVRSASHVMAVVVNAMVGLLLLCIVVRHMSHNVKKGLRTMSHNVKKGLRAMSLIKGLRTMSHNVMSLIKGLRTKGMIDNERYCRICMEKQKQQ